MSAKDFQGSYWAVKRFMAMAQEDIQQQRAKGVTVKWKSADRAKTSISWMKRRVLLGEFKKKA